MSTPAPFRWALRGAVRDVRHVAAVPPRDATGVVARVYAAAEREFGLLAPPLALHSPAPDLLAAGWVLLRETLLVGGTVDRSVKEAVAAAVSVANACPYCTEVHGAVLGGLASDAPGRADAAALAADRIADIAEPALRAVAAWARGGGTGPPPVPADRAPELLGVVLAFHYLNRMVQVFLGPSPLPPALPAAARGPAGAVLGRVLRSTARRAAPAGTDLDLLPAAVLPADMGWVAGDPGRARALARVAGAVEAAGARVLPPEVRHLVRDRLSRPGPSGPADDPAAAAAALPAPDRPAARLALRSALAPHRVDDATVRAFRGRRPDPADLVAVTAWASLSAARAHTRRAAATWPALVAPAARPARGRAS